MTCRIKSNHFSPSRWMTTAKWLLTSAMLLALFHATGHAGAMLVHGHIVRVTDGDTVTLQDQYQTLHKIRLAGIDAPESAMPYGQAATLFLTAMVSGKDVEAVTYKQDRYGRTIATLMLGTQDINLAMIQAGLAWHYKLYAKEQPAEQAQTYAQAEEIARAQHLALWQDSDPTAPWDWRADRRPSQHRSGAAIMLGKLAMHAGATP